MCCCSKYIVVVIYQFTVIYSNSEALFDLFYWEFDNINYNNHPISLHVKVYLLLYSSVILKRIITKENVIPVSHLSETGLELFTETVFPNQRDLNCSRRTKSPQTFPYSSLCSQRFIALLWAAALLWESATLHNTFFPKNNGWLLVLFTSSPNFCLSFTFSNDSCLKIRPVLHLFPTSLFFSLQQLLEGVCLFLHWTVRLCLWIIYTCK